MIVGVLKALFTVDATKFVSGMAEVKTSTAMATKSVQGANKSFLKLGTTMAATGLVVVASTTKLINMAKEIEAVDHKLRFATGGAAQAERAFKFLVGESQRLGISLNVLSKEFATFKASARGAAMTGVELRNVFTAVAEASAVLRMDARTTHLTFLALSQMLSKTVVSSEELKRQLGDHLPGAVQIMARAMGVSTRELQKMLESGSLLAEDVLPKFANVLRKDVAGGVKDLENSLTAAVGRLDTAWFLLKKNFLGEGSLMFKGLKISVDALTSSLNLLSDASSSDNFSMGLLGSPAMLQKAGDAINGVKKEIEDLTTEIEEEAVKKRYQVNYEGLQDILDMEQAAFKQEKAFFEERHSDVIGFFQSTLDSSLDLMQEWAKGGKLSFKTFADSIVGDLMKIIHEIAIAGPLMDSLRGFLDQRGGSSSGSTGGFMAAIGSVFKGMFSGATGFADGGMITEPIAGVGLSSGTRYTFGEEGAEMVTPVGKKGQASSGGSNNFAITINAIDSKSVTELMRSNPQAITIPIIESLTGGDRGLTAAMRGAI